MAPPKPGRDPGKAPASQPKSKASYAMHPKPLQTLPPSSPRDWYTQTLFDQNPQMNQSFAQAAATMAFRPTTSMVALRPTSSSSVVAPRPTSSQTVVAPCPILY